MLWHPWIANRDCGLCQKYFFNEDTGTVNVGRDGKPELRADYGEGNCPPPCRTENGCPKGTPEEPKSLNEHNQECYRHYCECRAVGQFPDDPVVRRNAAVIREIQDEYERTRGRSELKNLIQLIASK